MNMPTPLISKRSTVEIQRRWIFLECPSHRPHEFLCTANYWLHTPVNYFRYGKHIDNTCFFFHILPYPGLLPCKSLRLACLETSRLWQTTCWTHNYKFKPAKNIKHLHNANHHLGMVSITAVIQYEMRVIRVPPVIIHFNKIFHEIDYPAIGVSATATCQSRSTHARLSDVLHGRFWPK